MKTEKMNFKNIKDVLSRDEMKEIMAGSGESCGAYAFACINSSTQVYWCNCNGNCSFVMVIGGCYA